MAKDLEKTNSEVKNSVNEDMKNTPAADGTQAQPAKKRIAAVYRPQNSAQQKNRPGQGKSQGQGQGAKPQGQKTAGTQSRPAAKPQAEVKTETEPAPVKVEETPAVKPQVETKAPVAEAPAAQTETKAPANRDGQKREGGFQSRDGQPRDGQRREGGFQPRDGQKREGGFQPRDGQRREGGFQPRDGQRREGGFQPRDGQQRDGQRREGGFQPRDGQRREGGFQPRDGQQRDGQRREGGFQQRDGQRREGGFQPRDGQRREGGFQPRDGQQRDGQRREGGFQPRDGQRREGGFQPRDGQRREGGFNKDGFNKDAQGGREGGQQRGGQRRDGGLSIPKPAFETPINQKQQNTKATKNAYKKEQDAKKDRDEEMRGGKNGKGSKGFKAPVMQAPKKEEAKVEEVKTIILPEVITIKELAEKMKLQPSAIVKKLFLQGTIVTINQEIDFEKAEEIAMEYDVLCEKEEKVDVIEELLKEDEESEDDMITRPPVICVMGHVDHGKTSLLDAIRLTNVTAREAGGITQHIGAYTVQANDQKITFLDTPGHEAFTAMRMRGAQSTDIAILVVAADDGVMPQTIEAINHAKAAEVEIIVAVNKIDKPSANIERVKQELSEHGLIPEDWGGSTVFCPVSAKTKEGIPELLDMILLTAEVKELKANPNRKARGIVIEAQLDKGRGPVATVLVQKGTLKVGDSIAAGSCYGKVRAMMDDKGNRVKEAGPSTPVEILGLNDVPNAGEIFVHHKNEKDARAFAETFIAEGKNKLLEDTKAKLSLDDLFSQIKAGNVKELPLIIKADVQGSVEAVKQSLVKLSNEEVVVKVIHGGVGTINESDVTLASASNAIIIGFNVRPDVTAKSIADREKVDMRLYRVIYQAIEDIEAAMKGMLDPVYEEKITGHAIVRMTFKASGVGTIAGSYVTDGVITRGSKARITRGKDQIFEGPLASLKRFKDDVKEVKAGYECGLVFEGFSDLQEDDMIEIYTMVEVPR